MNRSYFILLLSGLHIASCALDPVSTNAEATGGDSLKPITDTIKAEPVNEELVSKWTYTTRRYPISNGDSLYIQSSLPRGDRYMREGGEPGYPDSKFFQYGAGIYWSRLRNETGKKMTLHIHYPADSFAISTMPLGYLFGLVLPDTMDLRDMSKYNYGHGDLHAHLDTTLHTATSLEWTLEPWEERTFLTSIVMKVPGSGSVRTELILQGRDLFYLINIGEYDPLLIPCGRIDY